MTMPHLMNCAHSDTGWCLTCVKEQWEELDGLKIHADKVKDLLELGDTRLMADEGPCGGMNAAEALSPKESAELYQACCKIAGV